MQTFLPYDDFAESLTCLDPKRLNKQISECFQILRALKYSPIEQFHRKHYKEERKAKAAYIKLKAAYIKLKYDFHKKGGYKQTRPNKYKRAWTNHPAARMWKGYEDGLCAYAYMACLIQINRDLVKEPHMYMEAFKIAATIEYSYPPWFGNDDFHASHRSNLLRKSDYYNQFGWIEPNDLPYIWPV